MPKSVGLRTNVVCHTLAKYVVIIFESSRLVGSIDAEIDQNESYSVEASDSVLV